MAYAHDVAVIATPVGALRIEGDDRQLTRIGFAVGAAAKPAEAQAVGEAARQLAAWFAGERFDFDLPLAPAATPRGDALRAGIAGIGFGETMSYGALALKLGSGARAIGQACARNRFPIVVPCHRVLGSATIGHYSGGLGPITKAALLNHEARLSGRDTQWVA